jgi:hypothetical protein
MPVNGHIKNQIGRVILLFLTKLLDNLFGTLGMHFHFIFQKEQVITLASNESLWQDY